MFRRTLALIAILAAVPSLALADVLGTSGLVSAFEVNTPSAETYLQYHGRLVITPKVGGGVEYRWGGTSCGSRNLSDENLAILQRALDNAMKVQPRYQPGQGDARCLVGVIVTP